MDPFTPGVEPPATQEAPLFIVFQGEEVLLDGDRVVLDALPAAAVPAPAPGAAEAPAPRRLYLGTLGGRPLFVAEAPSALPDAGFVPLRAALMAVPRTSFGLVSLAAQRLRFERTHAFCGRCGKPTRDKNGERAKTCDACELHVYPPVSPAIIVLVHDGRRLLLARRRKMRFFALVAGFVESGESLEECLVREVHEEIGVDCDDLRYFGSQPWPFPHQVMIGFYARWAGGAIAVDGIEIDEARWFDADALPELPPPISIARAMIDAFARGERIPIRT